MRIHSLASLVLLALALAPWTASAQTTFNVADEAALRTAITTAAPGDKIVLGADITLTTGDLPSVHSDITIDGGGHALSGNNQYRGLLVAAFGGGAAPTRCRSPSRSRTSPSPTRWPRAATAARAPPAVAAAAASAAGCSSPRKPTSR